jgi:hypothetical protein
MTEAELLTRAMARVPYVFPNVRVFRREIYHGVTLSGHHVKIGRPGQGDAYAYVRGGRIVEIEAKSAKGRLRESQIAWRTFCQSFGIPYVVWRALKGEAPEATVERWCEQLRAIVS